MKRLKNTSKKEHEKKTDLSLLKGKTILIADDNHVNNQLFGELFEVIFEGIDVHVLYASSGENAIELVEKHPKIDVILMDIRMPGMGGEKAAEILLKKNPSQKIIAQTAYAMSHEKEAFLAHGFSDYISKPINEDELLQKLVNWANQ